VLWKQAVTIAQVIKGHSLEQVSMELLAFLFLDIDISIDLKQQ